MIGAHIAKVVGSGLILASVSATGQDSVERTMLPDGVLARLEIFARAQAGREAWVRSREVLILEAQGKVGMATTRVGLSIVGFDGRFENWQRFRELSLDTQTAHPSTVLSHVRVAGIRPVIERFDGMRSITLESVEGAPHRWEGTLQPPGDFRFRMSALHCGYMLGEQWLSDVLSDARSMSATLDHGGFEAHLTPRSTGLDFRVSVDAFDRLRAIERSRDGRVVLRVDIDEYADRPDGAGLVAAGRRYVDHGDPVVTVFRFEYRQRSGDAAWTMPILEPPPPLREIGAVMRVRDMVTGTEHVVDARSPRPGSIDRGSAEVPQERSRSTRARAVSWLAAGFFAAGLGSLLVRRRHVRGRDVVSPRVVLGILAMAASVVFVMLALSSDEPSATRSSHRGGIDPDSQPSLASREVPSIELGRSPHSLGSDPPAVPTPGQAGDGGALRQVVGTLTDAAGDVVAGVELVLAEQTAGGVESRDHVVVTSSDGSFAFTYEAVDGQRMVLRGAKPSPYVYSKAWTSAGCVQRVDLICSTTACRLVGRLVAADGSPIRGGFVSASATSRVITGDRGEFDLESPVFHGECVLDYGTLEPPAHRTISLAVDASIVRGITLSCEVPTQRRRVRVVDEGGVPLAARIVQPSTGWTTSTDAQGECVVDCDAAGKPGFVVHADGFVSRAIRVTADDKAVGPEVIRLRRAVDIRVTVVDSAGRPCPGARVELEAPASDAGHSPAGLTNASGQVAMTLRERGPPLWIHAIAADGSFGGRGFPPQALACDVTVVVAPPRRLHGVVVDAHGSPVAGAWVHCVPLDRVAPKFDMPRTDARGRFSIPVVGDGRVEISARRPGHGRAVEWLASDVDDIVLSLPPATHLAARLRGVEAFGMQFSVRISVDAPGGAGERVVVPSRSYVGVDQFAVTLEEVPLDTECIVRIADSLGRKQVKVRLLPFAEPGRFHWIDLR